MRQFLCGGLLRSGQILDSALLLADRHKYQDIWILGRTLAELGINICYLQIASPHEFSRWSNYDLWTDERLISNLAAQIPTLENVLDPRELKQQKMARKRLEDNGLYTLARRGSWSERTTDERAKAADAILNLTPNVLQLLYRLAMKIGDGFVHSSPKAIGDQSLPVSSRRQPTTAEVQATAQALSMAATSVVTTVAFTRKRFGLSTHLLDERIAGLLRAAYSDSYAAMNN
jgi:hypothetical protein